MTLAQDRILRGQCPNDGKEAAPFRLCYDCRQLGRLMRALKKGAKYGTFKSLGGTGKYSLWFIGDKSNDPEARRKAGKNSTPFHLSDTDRRGRPRLRGITVDVEATLMQVIDHIGRPCTIEEITLAWGKLRDRRTSPLPTDLARLIKAEDKRKRRAEKCLGVDGAGRS